MRRLEPSKTRWWCLLTAAIALTFGGCLIIGPTAAVALQDHVFDARLSLTGGCGTTSGDPIPDPGLCPMPPGIPGVDHPLRVFNNPCGAATDSHGDVYVVSEAPQGSEGRIDVFDSEGKYLTSIDEQHHPCGIAVDSAGHVYVLENEPPSRVMLFTPASFPPQAGTAYSAEAAAVVAYQGPVNSLCHQANAIAVDPSNDHLYVSLNCQGEHIAEFGSAAENLPAEKWTPLREDIGAGIDDVALTGQFDVYGVNHDIYTAGYDSKAANGSLPEAQRVVIVDGATGEKKCESKGAAGNFSFVFGAAKVAVDQSNGDFYLDDTGVNKVVDHFDANCNLLGTLPTVPTLQHPDLVAGLAVDSPCIGPGETSCDLGGYHSPNPGYVFVGSGIGPKDSHLYAYKPRQGEPPEIEAQGVKDITDTEATLTASLSPHDLETTYSFEYITQADYEAAGEAFGPGAARSPLPPVKLGEGASFVPVATSIAGLRPDTAYRFRLVAENEAGVTQGEGEQGGEGTDLAFTTYPPREDGLPDGRGYEIVTPPDTGGYVPTMNELGLSPLAASAALRTDFAGPGGDSLLFGIEGGSLPGLPGGGFHDTYEAHREANGPYGRWGSDFNGIDGTEAQGPTPNGFSADHLTSFWAVREGIVAEEGNYVRRSSGPLDPDCSPEPGGTLEVMGCGSLGTDPRAFGGWISPGAEHVVFATLNENGRLAQRLEPQAPPTGTGAIYDRTADGVTHVVSLKPDGTPFAEGEVAQYLGTSHDGTVVVFSVGGTVYARLDDSETVEVAEGGPRFAGIAEHGGRIFFLRPNPTEPVLPGTEIPQGQIFACDVTNGPCAGSGGQAPVQIGSGDESMVVNVSADGSHVYFAEGNALYAWDGAGVQPVADLAPIDITGHKGATEQDVGGLGLWVPDVVAPYPAPNQGPASDPSRTDHDGAVLVFESHANLTAYDSAGHSQIYRYDAGAAAGERLSCLSCSPTGAAATADAELESNPPPPFTSLPPVNALADIANVSANGRRVFFQSADPLVLTDTDGLLDVYEWEADGEGDCGRAGGCVRLISSGQSATNDYLYAMTPDGHDVFFESGDLLVPRDHEAAPSIYDARVGGGEAPEAPAPEPCQGDACQPPSSPPGEVTPASAGFEGPGNPHGGSRRPGKHKQHGRHKRHRRHGHGHGHRRRAGHSKRGAVR